MRLQIALVAIWTSCGLFGQPADGPTFEAASIRPTTVMLAHPVEGPRQFIRSGNVKNLVQWAYDVDRYQISGGPEWFSSDSYLISAVASGDTNLGQMKRMVQSLLADRFQLKLHREPQEVPVYDLIVGKNGPKLTPAKVEVNPATASGPYGGAGFISTFTGGADLKQFAQLLTIMLDRPVLDKTSLAGRYDLKLTFDFSSTARGADRPPDDGQPSIFVAMEEQLGLKLEARKDSVEFIVIDSIERPWDN